MKKNRISYDINERIRAKDRSFIYRYPRLFVGTSTTLALLVFFSKPIYDLIFSEPQDLNELIRTHKSRLSKN